jgi:hypothetical protein
LCAAFDGFCYRLQAIGAALALFHIKNDSPGEPSMKWMYELTNGMTPEQVQEASDGVLSLMEMLNNGSEAPYQAGGTLTISKAGALLTWSGTEIGFPFQGVAQGVPGGHTQQRVAEKRGEICTCAWSSMAVRKSPLFALGSLAKRRGTSAFL